jgi:hypothetical protein
MLLLLLLPLLLGLLLLFIEPGATATSSRK